LADLAERAARLAKADLVSGMVGEFPELQGVIGGYLAERQGEPKAVADAIRDHYKPVGQIDEVPVDPVTVAVSLADKFDTLSKFFEINEAPTGSRDPFALRRAALAVCRLLTENDLSLNLSKVLPDSAREFVVERHRTLLKQDGYRYDVINAVRRFGGYDLLTDTLKVKDLSSFLQGENAQALVGGLKRVYNILRDVERGEPKRHSYLNPSDSELVELQEKMLFEEIYRTIPLVKGALNRNDFLGALEELSVLRPAIDAFFDNVRVNVGDSTLREHRLGLLAFIQTASLTVADFGELQG
jgi:glycyl-tRNA synthetase beta chain